MLLIYTLTSSFQLFFLHSKFMTSCHVTHNVAVVICLFIIQKVKKKKKNQIKENRQKKIKIKIKYKSSSIP